MQSQGNLQILINGYNVNATISQNHVKLVCVQDKFYSADYQVVWLSNIVHPYTPWQDN